MSKFFKALEQAKRDQALRSAPGIPVEDRAESDPTPSAQFTRPPVSVELPEGVEDHLVSLMTPAAFEAEQYRALRHAVEQFHKARDLHIVAVSSPAVGDGKTTTAINLAGALAQAPEARVLLVDADLRRPSVAKFLALPHVGRPGLVSAILDPTLSLGAIIQRRPPFTLSVIQAGQMPPTPYEVLKSPRFGELLEEARNRYDYIVLDAPPLCSVQDCRVIAQWVDGFLLVVAGDRTPRRLVEEAFNVVESGKMLGLVFNGAEHPPLGPYGYYGYYGGHPDAAQGSPNGYGRGRLGRALERVGHMLQRRRGGRP